MLSWSILSFHFTPIHIAIVQDTCRMGVWLGWHICYNATQVSQGQLRENRNLSWSIRAKAVLIYVLSVPVHNEKYSLNCSLLHESLSRVKARPSDPLVYVWILWCLFFLYLYTKYVYGITRYNIHFSIRKCVRRYILCRPDFFVQVNTNYC